ncbi:MAG: lipopolysaccharide heptosyltransferase II [Myxococcales bacterium]
MELEFAPSRIAVVQTAFLGDVVFVSPLARALKVAWPRARLMFVTTPKAAPLAACIPGVDAVVPFDKRREDSGLSGLRRVAAKLEKPDLILVPHPSLRSALLARVSGARVRVGHRARWTRWAYTVAVPKYEREPYVQSYLDLARALGIDGASELRLVAPAEEVSKAGALLGEGPCVGLVVGSEWATKRWPAASFARLADECLRRGWRPVLLGAPAEKPIAEAVKAAMKEGQALDLVGNTILESVGVISLLKAVVGGDSGLLHISRALGVPSLLLFGPTDPGLHNLEPQAQALRLGLECQPCHRHGPMRCPLGHHDCMEKLTVERVWEALNLLLARLEAA